MGLSTLNQSIIDLFDGQEAQHPTLRGEYHGENVERGVKYVNNPKKYEVRNGPSLTWVGRKGVGSAVDSDALVSYYQRKWNALNRDKPKYGGAVARVPGLLQDDARPWSRSLIWVITREKRIYSNVSKGGRFHHSSFTSGGQILSAGMWRVQGGRLIELAPLSGHYRPNMRQFMAGVMVLRPAVKAGRTRLLLYSTALKRFESVPYETWSKLGAPELFKRYQTCASEPRVSIVSTTQPGPMFYENSDYNSNEGFYGSAGY